MVCSAFCYALLWFVMECYEMLWFFSSATIRISLKKTILLSNKATLSHQLLVNNRLLSKALRQRSQLACISETPSMARDGEGALEQRRAGEAGCGHFLHISNTNTHVHRRDIHGHLSPSKCPSTDIYGHLNRPNVHKCL